MPTLTFSELNALSGVLFYLNKNVAEHSDLRLSVYVTTHDEVVPVKIVLNENEYCLEFSS